MSEGAVARVPFRKRVARVLNVDETLDRVDNSLDRFDTTLTEFNQTLGEFNRTLAAFTAALEHFGGVIQRVDDVGVELEGITGRLSPIVGGLDVMSDPSRLIPERVRRLGRSSPPRETAADVESESDDEDVN